MSMTFVSGRQRSEPTQQTVQSLLDENSQLIQAIVDYQSKGKAYECTQYQQLLHRNLVYLATLADSTQSMQNTIPAPGSQSSSNRPPASATPPSGGGMHGLPDMTPNSGTSSDMMPTSGGLNAGMPSGMNDPMKSNMPPQLGGMSGPTTAGYGASSVGGMGQSTSSPPQLQHPPMTAQSHMGYPNPSQSQQSRPVAPPTMSGPMGNLPPQVPPIQSHASPAMGQHMMSQNQPQSQQYMMQQRQMQFRQGAPQQMPQQQQSLSHSHPGYGPPSSGGLPSTGMMPGYPSQQQTQRFNPYRQPPQQQGLSHMPYQTQQQPGQSVMGQQPPMGQTPVGQSPMQQPPLV